jgi:flagellar motor switch protein FliM
MGRLLECPFEVELGAKDLRIPVRQLAELAPGGILTFARPAAELASLLVAGSEMFRAAPAKSGEHRAARLVAPVFAGPGLTTGTEEKQK